uniref:NADH-ubiquinone oxidoreductase chain 2 n=1 Tax=Laternula truncata TaxID=1199070 RepID=A0A1U9XPL4_9BIVA|nr:NADH dehydrogenase subunit 2 [Laternula truncata]AQZ26187.1 NADH dehydrogenase subunit 2 [Laternula truncata]
MSSGLKSLLKRVNLSPIEFLFLVISIFGIIICLSSPHWFGVWFGLELNLIGFIPVMAGQRSSSEIESCVKYFLAQGVGSGLLMLGAVGMWITGSVVEVLTPPNCNWFWTVMVIGLLLKLGVAPFHFWVPGTMAGISWMACLLLSSVQKIGPLFCFSYILSNKWALVWVGGLSALVGGVGGCFQTRLRPLLGYSSISHMGWCVGAMVESINYGAYYFLLYLVSILGLFVLLWEVGAYGMSALFSSLSIRKWLLLSLFVLSLSGLPPFAVFFGKVGTIMALVMEFPGAATLYVAGSAVSLYFYVKLIFLSWVVGMGSGKWKDKSSKKSNFSVPCFLGLCILSGFVGLW